MLSPPIVHLRFSSFVFSSTNLVGLMRLHFFYQRPLQSTKPSINQHCFFFNSKQIFSDSIVLKTDWGSDQQPANPGDSLRSGDPRCGS